LSSFFKTMVNVIAGILKFFASFTTFVPFLLLRKTTMSYFLPKWDTASSVQQLFTAPQRLLIKLTTVATILILYHVTHLMICPPLLLMVKSLMAFSCQTCYGFVLLLKIGAVAPHSYAHTSNF